MKEFLVPDNNEFTFEEFLTLCQVWYQIIIGIADENIKKVEEKIFGYRVKNIKTFPNDYSTEANLDLQLVHMKSNKMVKICFTVFKSWPTINVESRYYRLPDGVELTKEVLAFEMLNFRATRDGIILNKKFETHGGEFHLVVKKLQDTSELWPANDYLLIEIKSANKIDSYYYNLKTGRICVKNNDNYFGVSKNMQKAILSLLPSVFYQELPDKFKKIVKREENNAYRLEDGTIKYGVPSLIERVTNPDLAFFKRYSFESPEKAEPEVSFQEIVTNAKGYSLETSENSKSIIENIKVLLTKLKESKAETKSTPKFRLSDSIFFSSISEEKKEIDPFFKDPDIIKYCDLSRIDFTNADIRGACLAYSGANIDLDKVYGKSIEGADLEGIPLWNQDLDGINANNANLRKTHVCVSLERTSIVDTKFTSSSVFMLGMNVLSIEQATSMGLNIEEEKEEINISLNP